MQVAASTLAWTKPAARPSLQLVAAGAAPPEWIRERDPIRPRVQAAAVPLARSQAQARAVPVRVVPARLVPAQVARVLAVRVPVEQAPVEQAPAARVVRAKAAETSVPHSTPSRPTS